MRLFGYLIPNMQEIEDDKKDDKKLRQVMYEQIKSPESSAKNIQEIKDEWDHHIREGTEYVANKIKEYIIEIGNYYVKGNGYEELAGKLCSNGVFYITFENCGKDDFKINCGNVNVTLLTIVNKYIKSMKFSKKITKKFQNMIRDKICTKFIWYDDESRKLTKDIMIVGKRLFY